MPKTQKPGADSIMTNKYDSQATASTLAAELSDAIKGKVVLTTGVSPNGLGATFVETIAKSQPALLILSGRNTSKTSITADTITATHPGIKVRVLELDLGSLNAVRTAAGTVGSWADVPAIDVLVNNAGIMATDFGLSPDGFEKQFATNYLGHFLFANLIMDKLLASNASPRVVSVSSDGHRLNPIRWDDYNFRVRTGSI